MVAGPVSKGAPLQHHCCGSASRDDFVLRKTYCHQSRTLSRHTRAQVLPPIKSSSAAFSCSGIASSQELFRGIHVLRYRYCLQSRTLPRHSRAQVLPPIKSSSAAFTCSGIASSQELFRGMLVLRYCR
jgi:hypothetical protein